MIVPWRPKAWTLACTGWTLKLTLLWFACVAPSASAGAALVVYSAGPDSLAHQLGDAFERKTGVAVRIETGSTGQLSSRLNRERSNPLADVVILASWQVTERFAAEGRLLPYKAPIELDSSHTQHPHIVPQGVSALGIVWRRDSGLPRPGDWFDLAAPEYAGQVTMPSPVQSGSSFQLLAGLVSTFNNRAWDLFQQMAVQDLVIAENNGVALDAVLSGERGIVFGAVSYPAFSAIDAGADLEFILPTSGTILARRAMAIKASTNKPEQATGFLDFVLSEEGQSIVTAAHLIPVRRDSLSESQDFDGIRELRSDPRIAERRMGLLLRFGETILE